MKYLPITLISICFLLSSLNGVAQKSSQTYNTPYHTDNQNLWQPGSAGVLSVTQDFFGFSWNKNTTVGDITTLAGQDFGAEISAGTWGEIGSGITIDFGTENVEIDYNANMNVSYPTVSTFQAGDQIVFDTDWSPVSSGSGITPEMYDINMALWLRMGMGFDMSANLCMFGCTSYDIFDIDLSTDTYDLIEMGNVNGVTLLDGMVNFPPSGPYPYGFFPFIYSDPTGTMTLTLNLPTNTGPNANTFLNGDDLLYRNNTQYLDMYFSIASFIGALNIPYVSQFFGSLTNSWSTGPFSLSYTLLDAGFDLGLHNKQYLKFTPEMHGRLDFPAKIDFEVVNPSNGSVLQSGYDSVINYQPGQDVRVNFPCNYDFMDVIPSFSMDNQFDNHTYDSISFDFVFQALSFSINVNPVEVVPEICVPKYKPCGPSWCRICKWCRDGEICTPAVTFDGYNASFGPLVEITPNLYNTHYDWVNNSWEMQGFNSFDSLTPIHLEPAKFNVTAVSTDVLCHGGNSGEATATVSNGKPPYTYHWSNGDSHQTHQTNHTVSGLDAGTHYVSVTDDNGCMVFTPVDVSQPAYPLSTDTSLNHLSCYSSNDGSINLSVSGGTAPYSYMWSGGQTTDSVSGLSAGDHTVIITDVNNCSLSETFTLIQPQQLNMTISSQNVDCNGYATGFAEADVNGGTTPYNYNWSSGDTTEIADSLTAGQYNITVTDYNACSITDSVTITQPADSLQLSSVVSDVLCHGGSSGSIEVTASGGTTPYSYTWFNGDNTQLNYNSHILDSVVAGTYTCIVEDANGCSESVTHTIDQPDEFNYTVDVTDVLCYGNETGAVDVEVSGATSPYTYLWSDNSTTQDLDSVSAGTYDLTVTDANSCKYFISAIVDQPDEPLSSIINTEDVRCYGNSDGTIGVVTSGGTSPYTYLWSDSSNTSVVENVPADIYTVTITDANGCLNYTGGEVDQPDAPLDMTAVIEDVTCFGNNDGSISLEFSGGTIPYRILWNDNEFVINNELHQLNNLEEGIYNIKLMDENDCELEETFTIEQPEEITISFQTGIVSCFGGNDGYINTYANGGITPYTYDWSNGSQEENPANLTAGDYYLTLSDSHDCEVDTSVNIETYPEIIVDFNVDPKSCKDIDDAAIQLFPEGGTEEFGYSWSNGKKTKDLKNLASGNYSVTVTDGNYCEKMLDIHIPENNKECINIPSSFTPNGDGINDSWVLRNIDAYPDALVQVYRKDGRLIFEADGDYEPWDGRFENKDVPSGTYYYIVNLNNGDDPYKGSLTILR